MSVSRELTESDVDDLDGRPAGAAVSRRGMLTKGALAGAAVVASGPLSAVDAMAATRYRAVAYKKTPVPDVATRHLLSRFSYGYTPSLARDVRRAGGPLKWFDSQLTPERIDDGAAAKFADWWPALTRTPQQAWEWNVSGRYQGWESMADLARFSLLRRIYSPRQVHEVMAEFWSNLLHVPAVGESQFPWRNDYDTTVRAHALGTFAELLHATITHPAMLIYLDGATSTAKAPNENLGRELLELHTVGHSAGFTESHVKDSARILTGWRVDIRGTWEPSYQTRDHATGPVTVMGFSDPNGSGDGRELTRRYLDYLARHPATAKRIAHRLAVTFVSDNPPATLVSHLAQVYLANGTAIKPVLRALVRSAAFAKSTGQKVRTPSQDVIASYRVLGTKIARPTRDGSAANAILWSTSRAGQRVFGWPRPDGDPIVNDAWTGTARVLGSLHVHQALAGRWYPTLDTTYRTHASWVPAYPIRFDYLVDHLSRTILGRKSDARILKAACQMTGVGPREPITRDHSLVGWKMPYLLACLLDTPAHMTR